MRKLFTLLILMCCAIGMSADVTKYQVWVAGVQVTSDNKDNITGTGISGKVAYYPEYNKIVLTNATIKTSSSYAIYFSSGKSEDATIGLSGTNKIEQSGSKYAICFTTRSTNKFVQQISGSSLNIKYTGTEDAAVYSQGNIYMQSAGTINVETTSKYGFWGYNKKHDFKVYYTNLNISAGSSAIQDFTSLTFDKEHISYPDDCSFSSTDRAIVNKSGYVQKYVVFSPGEYYNIMVGGKKVTSVNASDILGDGKVSYDSSTNTLTLNNASITSTTTNYGIYVNTNATVKLVGTNKITLSSPVGSLFKTEKGTDVTIISDNGTGVLNLSSSNMPVGLYSIGTTTIKNCTVNITAADYGIAGDNIGTLNIDNATVTAKGTEKGSITSLGAVNLKGGVVIQSPSGAKVSGGAVVDASGNTIKEKVTIGVQYYGFSIAGNAISSANIGNYSGVSFDYATKTLTLNNANLTSSKTDFSALSIASSMTVKVLGTNNIKSTATSKGRGLNLNTGTVTITGGGTLNVSTNCAGVGAISIYNTKVTIKECTVNALNEYSGSSAASAIWDCHLDNSSVSQSTLYINNATVTAKAPKTLYSSIRGFADVQMTNCGCVLPQGGTYDKTKCHFVNPNGDRDSGVEIVPTEKYGITVGGTEITNINAYDVFGNGQVKYDNSTKTLSLNNANISSETGSGIHVQNLGSTLKIELAGTNKVKSSKFNGIYAGNTSLEISGSSNATLDVSTDYEGTNGYSPIMLYGSGKHTFSNCKITTNNKNYGIRANGSSTITLDGVTINGNVTANSIYAGALADFKTINLKNSTIKSTSSGIYAKDIAASINLDGANNITSTEAHGIMLEGVASTTSTISSKTGGSLDITASSNGTCAIMFGTSLLVKDCTLTGTGTGSGLIGETEWQYLTIDNATVKAKATNSGAKAGAIQGISKLELKNGIQIISPDGAAYNESLYGVAKDGALCKSVEIGVKGYSIKVDGKSITSQNCNDVLGDGKVKFNPETNTLTLNNATITSSNQALLIGAGTYTLDLIGNNTITGTNLGLAVALGVLNVTSSTGTGKLTCSAAASGNSTGAIATAIGAITIENCTVEAKNSVGIAINGLEAGALTIKNANVTANGKEACIAGFTELNLEGCYIDEPGGAEIKAEGEYKSVYLAGSYAKDQNVVIKSGDNPHIVPPTIPSTLVNVNNLTHESFSLSWTAATDNDTPQSDIVYFITYTNKTTGEMLTKEVTGETTATIGGLASETTYEVTLRAYDKDGNNALYGTLNVITSTAPDVTAPILPTDAQIAVTDVTTKSVTISWNAATDDRSTADAINYKVEWNIGDTFVNSTTLNGSTTTYEILNLTPETEYTITVTAIDEAGNTADYTPLKVSTLAEVDETAPTLPADATIYVNEATEKSLTIAWFAASDDKTDASKLQYEVNILVNGEWKTLPIVTGTTTCKIEDLEPGTEYKIAVYVYDESGNSMCYDVLTTSTEAVDAIDAILADNPDVKMYNTSGVLVNKNYRGVVIINGKKYMKTK